MFLPGKYKFFAVCDARKAKIKMKLYLPTLPHAPRILKGGYYVGHVHFVGAYDYITVTFETNKGNVIMLNFVNLEEDLYYSFHIRHGNERFYKITESDLTILAMENLNGSRNVR